MEILTSKPGWAEQDPEIWWKHAQIAIQAVSSKAGIQTAEIKAIGISYQMHGLVCVDKDLNVLRNSIIWCDSRAVEIGNNAFRELGAQKCLSHLLNSPGNFTASKLKWVKENEPEIFSSIYKIMLPGDYIALRLTGEIHTTISGLSEGILWNFKRKSVAAELIQYYGLDPSLIPDIVPTFGAQGKLTAAAAAELGFPPGIPIAYRAGDQPNNALSLNVLSPGDIAATAGTSGVIYGVTDKNVYDHDSRVNTFAHVNYSEQKPNNGVLLCINGTGIQYSWLKQNILENKYSYNDLNDFASAVAVGADGLFCHPFGNGAERILKNKDVHAEFTGINFNIHSKGHVIRAAQEGIAYAFKYGLDIMTEMGMEIGVVKAGNSNLFQSKVFIDAFVNTCNINLEIYNTDGAQGAARGAGIGIGRYSLGDDAFHGLRVIAKYTPNNAVVNMYNSVYQDWKKKLGLNLQ